MNAILGFTELFSGPYFCRLCLMDKDNAQNIYNEDDPKVAWKGIFEVHYNDLQSDPQMFSVFGRRTRPLRAYSFFTFVIIFLWTLCLTFLKGWLSLR